MITSSTKGANAMITSNLNIYYHPGQVFDPKSYSQSPLKPQHLFNRLKANPIPNTMIQEPEAVMPIALSMIHDPIYVMDVLNGVAPNGFGKRCTPEQAKALLLTAGNFLDAADDALENQSITVSLTSGAHHACYGHGGGFCTFNFLMLAPALNPEMRYLIVDGDIHHGNGCIDIMREKRELMGNVRYFQDESPIYKFAQRLQTQVFAFDPHVIIYQAGADAWQGDPLGMGPYSKEALEERDRVVLDLGVPTVINLAGGYAENYDDTLEIHMNTLRIAAEMWYDRQSMNYGPEG
jgi:acetoin utilization deacetylase AcuC-like enzyme